MITDDQLPTYELTISQFRALQNTYKPENSDFSDITNGLSKLNLIQQDLEMM